MSNGETPIHGIERSELEDALEFCEDRCRELEEELEEENEKISELRYDLEEWVKRLDEALSYVDLSEEEDNVQGILGDIYDRIWWRA